MKPAKSKLDQIQALSEGLAALPEPAQAPSAPQAAPAEVKPPKSASKPDTVPVNLRMPADLRDWFVRHSAKLQAETGKPTSAQAVMLEALQAWRSSRG